jgi:hypothetical protein
MNTIIKGYIVDNNGAPISGVKVNLTSDPGSVYGPPPTYNVNNGGVITFNQQGTQLTPILSLPSGQIITGTSSNSLPPEELAKELLLNVESSLNLQSGTLTFTEGRPTSNYKKIDDSKKTNNKGEWEFTYPSTDINPKIIKIIFSKSKYDLKTIDKPIITQSTTDLITIDIARVTLQPTAEVTDKESAKIIQETNNAESKETKSNSKPSVEGIIAETINNKKEELKRKLIPFILKLILPFGALALQAILAKLPQSEIAKLANCPSQATIQQLVNKRNKLVKQINNLYNLVTKITKALKIVNIVIIALKIGLLAVAAIPPPTFPGAVSVLNSKLSKLLDIAGVGVSLLTITVATFGAFLGIILNLLNSLDFLLQKCSEDNAQAQAEIQADAILKSQNITPSDPNYELIKKTEVQTQLKSVQNLYLEQISDEINALASDTIEGLQQSQPNDINTYKGFKLEVKINEKNTSQFIQRYAQALDKNNVPVLKTEPSFASDPQVLIDQLKFIIDSNPNITAE